MDRACFDIIEFGRNGLHGVSKHGRFPAASLTRHRRFCINILIHLRGIYLPTLGYFAGASSLQRKPLVYSFARSAYVEERERERRQLGGALAKLSQAATARKQHHPSPHFAVKVDPGRFGETSLSDCKGLNKRPPYSPPPLPLVLLLENLHLQAAPLCHCTAHGRYPPHSLLHFQDGPSAPRRLPGVFIHPRTTDQRQRLPPEREL